MECFGVMWGDVLLSDVLLFVVIVGAGVTKNDSALALLFLRLNN